MINYDERAIDIIKYYEGFRSKQYKCSGDVLTVGFGTTESVIKPLPNNISEAYATELLEMHVKKIAITCSHLISRELTESQGSALISFVYNLGSGTLQRSTMRQLINRGDMDGACKEFPKFRRGGGQILRGLVIRRSTEAKLWDIGDVDYEIDMDYVY